MNDNWTPDPNEVKYLSKFGKDAVIAIGDHDGIPRWQIGLAAGISSGVTQDEKKRLENLRSSVSRRIGTKRGKHPHIRSLQEHLKYYRKHGEQPLSEVADLTEVLKSATETLRSEGGSSRDKARDILFAYWTKVESGSDKKHIDLKQLVDSLVAQVGKRQAKAVLAEYSSPQFAHGAVEHYAPAERDQPFEDRLERLERRA